MVTLSSLAENWIPHRHGSWWLLTCETYTWAQDHFTAEGTHAEVTSEWFEHIKRDH